MTQRTFSVLLLATLVSAPATAEDLKTYIWRDADGKVHYGDSPPRHEDYEEKMIPVDSNTVAAERAPAGSGRSVVDDDDNEPRGSSSDPERGLTPEDIADIAEEQQRQLGDDDAIGDEMPDNANSPSEVKSACSQGGLSSASSPIALIVISILSGLIVVARRR